MKRRVLYILLVSLITSLFTIFFLSCGTNKKQKEIGNEQQYVIINEEDFGDIKTMLDIRLKLELDIEALTKIAQKIKNDGRSKYQRIFIDYYLPDMEVGSGAWATSHFNPDLDVQILGLSKGDKAQILENTDGSENNLIGRWIDNTPGLSGVYSISKKDTFFELSIKYKDGSGHSKKLIEKIVNGQKRWIEENNDFGEYYVLNTDGTLSQYDSDGLIRTLPKTK